MHAVAHRRRRRRNDADDDIADSGLSALGVVVFGGLGLAIVGTLGYAIYRAATSPLKRVVAGEGGGRDWAIYTGAANCPNGFVWTVTERRFQAGSPWPAGHPLHSPGSFQTRTIATGCAPDQQEAQARIDENIQFEQENQ